MKAPSITTVALALLIAACAADEEVQPSSGVVHLDRQIPRSVSGLVTELREPQRVELDALELRTLLARGTDGATNDLRLEELQVAELPWAPDASTLTVTTSTGERLDVRDELIAVARRGGCAVVPSTRRFDGEGGRVAFGSVVGESTVRARIRPSGDSADLATERPIEAVLDDGTVTRLRPTARSSSDAHPWIELSAALSTPIGARQITLRVSEPIPLTVEWIEVAHHGPAMLVARSEADAVLSASFVPEAPRALERLWASETHGELRAPIADVDAHASGDTESIEATLEQAETGALARITYSGGPGWVSLEQPRARALVPSSVRSADAPGRVTIGADHRAAVWLPASSAIEFDAALERGDRVRFAVAQFDASASSGGVWFVAGWQPDGGEPVELARVHRSALGWHEVDVELPEGAHGAGTLRFETTADEPAGAAIGQPRIVRAQRSRPNLLLYVIDTLRADHVGCYGANNPTTPHIDRIASEGFRFDAFHAVAPWTRPSTATLLTGIHPRWHNVGANRPLPMELETLAETLRAAGYTTLGATANPQTGASQFQFAQGFQRFVDHTAMRDEEATSTNLNRVISPWLRAFANEPFFLYVHSIDPHTPYDAPRSAASPFGREYAGVFADRSLTTSDIEGVPDGIGELDRRYIVDRYDNEILQQDAELAVLLDTLADVGVLDDTIVAIVSDHGEEFGEHGGWNHGYHMWDELLRVPFILWLPPNELATRDLAPRAIAQPLTQVDFLPGMLDLLGVDDVFPRHGTSWVPALAGGAPALSPLYSVDYQLKLGRQLVDGEIGALRLGAHKLIWTREATGPERLALFDMESDPGEQHDLAELRPDLVEKLLDARARAEADVDGIAGRMRAIGLSGERLGAPPAELDLATREALRQLGYAE